MINPHTKTCKVYGVGVKYVRAELYNSTPQRKYGYFEKVARKIMPEECIFCKIASGKISSYRVYEDEDFLGFLDINPRVRGHTLVIPKKHYRWIYDVDEFDKYWQVALKITKAMQKALHPAFITYLTHGLEVPHAHIWILPRQNETSILPAPIQLSKDEMQVIAQNIQKAV